ncbi:MAG: peptidoglycan synthetase [Paludibacteraceae bacterium]|nr:peptidoglycan synthetase [Paludibacteraceae bacterium]
MRIHFIAIGGAAMHNLALAVSEKEGYVVTGSDDEIFDPARSRLQAKGLLPSEIGWHAEKITKDIDAVILGMHAREDNPELIRAKELGLKIYSFPEYLYEQTKDKIRIVVGGSHGKTTTTAMILYAMKKMGIEADYMVGAQIAGFENMVRLSDTAKYAVFEGDEYLTSPLDLRSKFLLYHPHIAILTGIAWDHINVFPTFDSYVDTFRKFVGLIEPNGTFIYFDGDENLRSIASKARKDIGLRPYNTPEFVVEDGQTSVVVDGEKIKLSIFGRHNLQNLCAACNVLCELGIGKKEFFEALSDFTGASNRLERIVELKDRVAFKDFAHSPSKLRATINAVREQYQGRKIVAAMELHTFSSLMADFLPQYKGCMSEADIAFVYFNPKVVEHKRLKEISVEQVKEAFGGDVRVFTSREELEEALLGVDYKESALLMMTSGTFDGMDIKQFATKLLEK